jgi:hypothetical protein
LGQLQRIVAELIFQARLSARFQEQLHRLGVAEACSQHQGGVTARTQYVGADSSLKQQPHHRHVPATRGMVQGR